MFELILISSSPALPQLSASFWGLLIFPQKYVVITCFLKYTSAGLFSVVVTVYLEQLWIEGDKTRIKKLNHTGNWNLQFFINRKFRYTFSDILINRFDKVNTSFLWDNLSSYFLFCWTTVLLCKILIHSDFLVIFLKEDTMILQRCR